MGKSRQQSRKVFFRPNNPQIFHTIDAALVAFPETKAEDWLKADSTGEYNRFEFLLKAMAKGEISNLYFHPQFCVLPQTKLPKSLFRPKAAVQSQIKYTADYSYLYKGVLIIEDWKASYSDTVKNRAKGRAGQPIVEASARLRHKLLSIYLIEKYGDKWYFKIVTNSTAPLDEP